MGIFEQIFGKEKSHPDDQNFEQEVFIQFIYGLESLDPLHHLEEELRNIIYQENVGEYDGHEIALDYSHGFLYMYGPNAEPLFKAVKVTLEKTDFMQGAIAKLIFGPHEEGVKEIEVRIGD